MLLKKYVRQSKYDPFVKEVDLVEANPEYALIRYKEGRESTVSITLLAPRGDVSLVNLPSTDENIAENNVTDPNSEDSNITTYLENNVHDSPDLGANAEPSEYATNETENELTIPENKNIPRIEIRRSTR